MRKSGPPQLLNRTRSSQTQDASQRISRARNMNFRPRNRKVAPSVGKKTFQKEVQMVPCEPAGAMRGAIVTANRVHQSGANGRDGTHHISVTICLLREAWQTTARERSAKVLLIRILYSSWVHNICLCWSTVYKILIQSNHSYRVYGLRTIRSPLDEYYTGGGGGASWRARCTAENCSGAACRESLLDSPRTRKDQR